MNANPFSEMQNVTFHDFLQRIKSPVPQKPKRENVGMTSAQVERQVAISGAILDGYTPPLAVGEGGKSPAGAPRPEGRET